MEPRRVRHRYADPLDRIWLTTVERLGFRVARTAAAYATTDGAGTIGVGTSETLDPDDCLAQILFHELCHALTQGEANLTVPDWGLCNETTRDTWREHACLRVQAALGERHGLRRFLAPTTDYRAFYDALPADPFAGDAAEPSIVLGRETLARYDNSPWRGPMEAALRATAAIASAARAFAAPEDLLGEAPSVAVRVHPQTGYELGPAAERCGSCAWRTERGHCRVARRAVRAESPACLYWEGPLDCQACGACCREAYHTVELGPREPILELRPDLVEHDGGRAILRRRDGLCPALVRQDARYTCVVYDARPRTCRDFERGGANCLDARRRVGLSFKPPRA